MGTQILKQQVIHISNELKNTHGDNYPFTDHAQHVVSKRIDYDNKDKVIASLKKKLKELEDIIKI
jgi:hypothetical protein